MNDVARRCEEAQHHPRWSNEKQQLRIRFTTWDAGNKITHYDVEAAHMIDDAYEVFKARKKNGKPGTTE
jgi:pterin-4a-carbinolamine dehydratase